MISSARRRARAWFVPLAFVVLSVAGCKRPDGKNAPGDDVPDDRPVPYVSATIPVNMSPDDMPYELRMVAFDGDGDNAGSFFVGRNVKDAGTQIHRVSPDGTVETAWTTVTDRIISLRVAKDDQLYATTLDPETKQARLVRLRWHDTPQDVILPQGEEWRAAYPAPNGWILVERGSKDAVMDKCGEALDDVRVFNSSWDEELAVKCALWSPQRDVTADSLGNVYALAREPNSVPQHLIRITRDGAIDRPWKPRFGGVNLAIDSKNAIYHSMGKVKDGAAGQWIRRVDPDGKVTEQPLRLGEEAEQPVYVDPHDNVLAMNAVRAVDNPRAILVRLSPNLKWNTPVWGTDDDWTHHAGYLGIGPDAMALLTLEKSAVPGGGRRMVIYRFSFDEADDVKPPVISAAPGAAPAVGDVRGDDDDGGAPAGPGPQGQQRPGGQGQRPGGQGGQGFQKGGGQGQRPGGQGGQRPQQRRPDGAAGGEPRDYTCRNGFTVRVMGDGTWDLMKDGKKVREGGISSDDPRASLKIPAIQQNFLWNQGVTDPYDPYFMDECRSAAGRKLADDFKVEHRPPVGPEEFFCSSGLVVIVRDDKWSVGDAVNRQIVTGQVRRQGVQRIFMSPPVDRSRWQKAGYANITDAHHVETCKDMDGKPIRDVYTVQRTRGGGGPAKPDGE